jgi:hypothetical protein
MMHGCGPAIVRFGIGAIVDDLKTRLDSFTRRKGVFYMVMSLYGSK